MASVFPDPLSPLKHSNKQSHNLELILSCGSVVDTVSATVSVVCEGNCFVLFFGKVYIHVQMEPRKAAEH